MHLDQLHYTAGRWMSAFDAPTRLTADRAQLVLVFGDRDLLAGDDYLAPLRDRFPTAELVLCSSGGDVADEHVVERGLVATAIEFAHAGVRTAAVTVASPAQSGAAGEALGHALPHDGLRHVLVFAEGLLINGSELAQGLARALPAGVSATGGLAADGDRFQRTVVGLNDRPASGRAVAVGLYGESLHVGTGSLGGWEPFGPTRVITRSEGNKLYELDGRPALALYGELLGPLGYALPASGLAFPLTVRESPEDDGVVRTILGVDEREQSVTFAGDVPEGWTAQLMRTDLDRLIRAAGVAATRTSDAVGRDGAAPLVLAVSCIGRKMLLQRRVHEELASVRRAFGEGTRLAGFYSYGEIAPLGQFTPCSLHNQTMTLTAIAER